MYDTNSIQLYLFVTMFQTSRQEHFWSRHAHFFMVCPLCDVKFLTKHVYNMHMAGKKHQMKEKEVERERTGKTWGKFFLITLKCHYTFSEKNLRGIIIVRNHPVCLSVCLFIHLISTTPPLKPDEFHLNFFQW